MIEDSKDPDICLYHAHCLDGFTAAWVVQLKYPGIECVAVQYNKPPPFVVNRRVIIVDFSYPPKIMLKLAREAKEIVVIDHHENAALALEEASYSIKSDDSCCPFQVIFDNELSGCGLTWNTLYPEIDPPKNLLHVQDRDLWQFKIPGTREITAAMQNYEMEFKVWYSIMNMEPRLLMEEGTVIERYQLKLASEIIAACKGTTKIFGPEVPICPAPHQLASMIGNLLSVGYPFSVVYTDIPEGRKFSLRSQKEDGADVSAIAREHGGNGHKNAAGFVIYFKRFDRIDA